MRKISSKLILPAIAAAGAVTGGLFSSSAKADFTLVLSGPVTGSGDSVYTLSVENNGPTGAQNTGTQLDGFQMTVATAGTSTATALVVKFEPVSGTVTNDANILGEPANGQSASAYMQYGSTAAANLGTFMNQGGYTSAFSLATVVSAQSASGPFTTDSSMANNNDWESVPSKHVTQTVNPNFSNLHSLEIAGTQSNYPDNTFFAPIVNIVVPTGVGFTINGQVGGNSGTAQNYAATVTGSGGGGGGSTYPIIVLKASPGNTGGQITNGAAGTTAAPQGTYTVGAATSTLTVSGGNSVYSAGFIHSITAGTNAGFTTVAGFTPTTDTEIFLLKISDTANGASPSAADITQIDADINNASAGNSGVVASPAASSPLANLGGTAWNIELTFASPVAPNTDFGFNFAGETNIAGVTVTDIAAVPEPASAGLLLVGGLGLLARRRRSAN
jgi:hypothetical protein